MKTKTLTRGGTMGDPEDARTAGAERGEGEAISDRRVAAAPCPVCGRILDAACGPGPERPGDLTLCLYCRAVLVFTDTRGLQLLTNAAWAALDLNTRREVTRLREGILTIRGAADAVREDVAAPLVPLREKTSSSSSSGS
jgi:hypothetical protein